MDSRRLRFVVATLVSVSLLGGLLASVPQFSSAATTLDGKKERVSVFGENGEDEFRSIVKASDGTLVAAGITTTNTIGDYGGSDGFVTKINQDAVGLWSTNIGGTSFDAFYSITEASDGGFVMAGGTTSLDFTGSLDPNRKSRDAAIAKIGPLNNQLWAQATGGGGDDFFNGVAACPDTGFIAVGWSDSLDGDIWDPINPDGGQDGIIVKYDKDGTKKWLRSTGGTNDDGLLSVAVAADGGFVVAGYTSSTNKDISTNSKSAPKGGQDGFIIRFDKWTNILWEANVGGSALDNLQTVAFTSDGGVVAVGVTYSTDGDAVKNKGGMDGLMIKLDKNGNKQWSRTFGGAGNDGLRGVAQTNDGGYVVVGDSMSSSGDLPADNHGGWDGFIARLDASGNTLWSKNVGGGADDYLKSVAIGNDGSFYAAGYTSSTNGDVPGNRSGTDAIIAHYTEYVPTTPSETETSASPIKTQVIPDVEPGSKKYSKAPIPAISGVKKVGRKLTAKAGTWSPAAQLTYNWYRNGKAIKGAYTRSYTLTASDLGKKITVKVTGYKTGYTTTAKTSKQTAKIGLGELTRKPVPNITGTRKVGSTLTAKAGTWKPAVTKKYQWYRNGKKIKGATKSTYKLVKADAGKKITVKLTATKAGYKTVAKTSKPTKIAALPKPKPVSTPTPSPTYTEPCEFGTDKC